MANPDKHALEQIIEKLSPIEIKIIPFLNSSIKEIEEKSGLDKNSVIMAMKFLENKGIIKISSKTTKFIDLGTNGIYYKKNHLPERRLLILLEKESPLDLEHAKKLSNLSKNEFKVSLGVLKSKAVIELKSGKLFLNASKSETSKRTLEEQFIESLPIEIDKLTDEQRYSFENLKKRKEIIEIKEEKIINFSITPLGKELAGKEIKSDLIEEVTPEVIKNWNRNKKFRHYDILTAVPKINGGKKHFVNQAIDYARKIWLDLGFQEMTGTLVQTSFWNFDALFTAQDHPVRELHDTFYIKGFESSLPNKNLVQAVKQAHESGVKGSKGWQYQWHEKEAIRPILRTHTTSISANTLSKIKSNIPSKFFALGKCFRNETVDWSHGFEFNQTEGIVIDRNANFMHLLGYLKEFFKKMGFENIRFTPSYFPYTEPSLEGDVWDEERKEWVEVFAGGIFRPEVVYPLIGEWVPVLAWGPGFDRMVMKIFGIKDL